MVTTTMMASAPPHSLPLPRIGRQLRVGYQPNQAKGSPKPQLRFSGQWLADLGFTTGKQVEVHVEPGKITITLVEEETTSPATTSPIRWNDREIEVLHLGRPRRFSAITPR